MTQTQPRPWYVYDGACDEWITVLSNGGDFPVLKSLKIIRSIIVNVGVLLMTTFLVSQGGQPTYFGTFAFLFLSAYNSLEFSDYLALLRAYEEVKNDDQ